MSISQANVKWISQVSGVSVEEISGALSKEEEVTLDMKLNGRVVSQDEETTLKEDSFKRGSEIRTKEIATSLDITLDEGEHKKEAKIVAEKLKSGLKLKLKEEFSGKDTSEREKELEGELQKSNAKYDKLFETHGLTKKQIEDKEKELTNFKTEIKTRERNSTIKKSFPTKMKMDVDDALLIFNNTFRQEENESGEVIFKRGDKIVTDSVGQPEKAENIVASFIEEKNWIKSSGMGGGDRGGGGSDKGGKTPDEARKVIIEKGIAPTSPEGLKLYSELTA